MLLIQHILHTTFIVKGLGTYDQNIGDKNKLDDATDATETDNRMETENDGDNSVEHETEPEKTQSKEFTTIIPVLPQYENNDPSYSPKYTFIRRNYEKKKMPRIVRTQQLEERWAIRDKVRSKIIG